MRLSVLATGLAAAAVFAGFATGSPVSADEEPLVVTAIWDDSLVSWAGEYLQPCGETAEPICIDEVWVTRAGQRVEGVLKPSPNMGWLYEFEVAGDVQTYWLAMTTDASRVLSIPNGPFVSVWLYFVPVEERPDGGPHFCYSGSSPGYSWCRAEFSEGQRLGVSLRSSLRAQGWIDARMIEPSVNVTPSSGTQPGRVTIEGAPARIPVLKAPFSYDNPLDRDDWLTLVDVNSRGHGDSSGGVPTTWDQCRSGNFHCGAVFPALTPYTFAALSEALPQRLAQATGWMTVWRAQTYFARGDTASECLGEFSGLTSSNAMTYQQVATFDSFTREVSFTMAGPTYDADGKRLTGDFSLVMTEKAAQCLWGTFDIGDRFTIQVTNEDGVEQVGTSTVTRRDGQIVVRAVNFGFSLKRTSLTQIEKGAPAAPARVKATGQSTGIGITWKTRPGLSYRMRITTGDGDIRQTVRTLSVAKGKAVVRGLAKGEYRVELIAVNRKGQSPASRATVTVP